jgi:hypothetical protein
MTPTLAYRHKNGFSNTMHFELLARSMVEELLTIQELSLGNIVLKPSGSGVGTQTA